MIHTISRRVAVLSQINPVNLTPILFDEVQPRIGHENPDEM